MNQDDLGWGAGGATDNAHPEWAGYLAAFDAFVGAKARGDRERAGQARLVMDWLSDRLIGELEIEANPDDGFPALDLSPILAVLEH